MLEPVVALAVALSVRTGVPVELILQLFPLTALPSTMRFSTWLCPFNRKSPLSSRPVKDNTVFGESTLSFSRIKE